MSYATSYSGYVANEQQEQKHVIFNIQESILKYTTTDWSLGKNEDNNEFKLYLMYN